MSKKFWWAAIIIFFIQMLAVAIFTPFGWAHQAIDSETKMIRQVMGGAGTEQIVAEAAGWHQSLIIDSGLYDATVRALIPTSKQKEQSRGIQEMGTAEGWFGWVQERIDTVSSVIHQTLIRVSLLKTWLPYIAIIFIPAVYDGFMTWKVKRTNFLYASPTLNRYGARGVALLSIIFVLLFFAPLAIHPIYIPAGLILASLLVGITIGNMQKRI